jgi:hypothetical protein
VSLRNFLEKQKQKGNEFLMSTYYASRRLTRTNSASWSRNRNIVRHDQKTTLGPISHIIFLSVLVLLVGLLFTSQSAKVTDYDLEIAKADSEITELEAQRDALAVENAKITAAVSDVSTNEVAASMVDANSADFVQE